jgi:hypothetical protein
MKIHTAAFANAAKINLIPIRLIDIDKLLNCLTNNTNDRLVTVIARHEAIFFIQKPLLLLSFSCFVVNPADQQGTLVLLEVD